VSGAAPLRVAYVPLHLSGYEAEQHDVVGRSRRALEDVVQRHGGALLDPVDPIETRPQAERVAASLRERGPDLVVVQSASFAMGDLVLPFADAGHRLCLWAPDEPRKDGPIPLNGFVSMHLQAGVLRRRRRAREAPVKWLFGDAGHPWFGPRLDPTLRALKGLARVERRRIALVGGVAPSFLNVVASDRRLDERLGCDVAAFELGPVIDEAERLRDASDVDELADEVAAARRAVDGRVDVSDADLRANVAVFVALRRLAREAGADALAVSDWPLFQQRMRLHPGLAFSRLDDAEGLPVASEGDVGGALSMLLARGVSDEPAMLLDVNDVDLERGALLTWHCGGSPTAIADERGVRWTPHTTLARGAEPALGTVADLRFRRGPVTLLRVGDDAGRLFVVDAEVIETPLAGFDGSRGWIGGFRGPHGPVGVGDVVETLVGGGVEHHLALVPGHHADAVREAAAWLGAEVVPIARYADGLVAGRESTA
jgi:hypothetical protein